MITNPASSVSSIVDPTHEHGAVDVEVALPAGWTFSRNCAGSIILRRTVDGVWMFGPADLTTSAELIVDYEFYEGQQWTPAQIATMRAGRPRLTISPVAAKEAAGRVSQMSPDEADAVVFGGPNEVTMQAVCDHMALAVDRGLVGEEADGWEPSEADVERLAAAIIAGTRDCSYTEALRALATSGLRAEMLRGAKHAFDHPGYLPSIVSARRDAMVRVAQLEDENATLRATLVGTEQAMTCMRRADEKTIAQLQSCIAEMNAATAPDDSPITSTDVEDGTRAAKANSSDAQNGWLQPMIDHHRRWAGAASTTSGPIFPAHALLPGDGIPR